MDNIIGSPIKEELEVMVRIAKECCGDGEYLLETGSGYSTICFAANGIKVVSIDLFSISDEIKNNSPDVVFLTGWSIADSDMIKCRHSLFRESRYKNTPDQGVAFDNCNMVGETDLIRKVIKEYGVPKFFFCDTGEYCGYAEWLIIKKIIPVGGFIALHDIHYPHSIKNDRAYEEIRCNPKKWEIIYKSFTKAGLCVAVRKN
ncbi:hypothetical protein LCGC14_1879940 [marine sediment metagenome]|uniref:Methyltransferase domain-containing protein n=1 Tax=marine sediment metagenome TaxID=412755 RepID=A0A0F9IGM1_9ZZZZ